MRQPSGYDRWIHGRTANHAVRMDACSSALRRAVKPGCRVLDLDSGNGVIAQGGARGTSQFAFSV